MHYLPKPKKRENGANHNHKTYDIDYIVHWTSPVKRKMLIPVLTRWDRFCSHFIRLSAGPFKKDFVSDERKGEQSCTDDLHRNRVPIAYATLSKSTPNVDVYRRKAVRASPPYHPGR